MVNWTDQYFGPLYGEIYRDHLMEPERAVEEAAFAAQVLDLGRCVVLDLACGDGRHARLLAASNRVIAVDRNQEYLTHAKDHLKEKTRKNLQTLRSDMRALPLADVSMDAVVMLFNSFGYFIDSAAAQSERSDFPGDARQIWKLPRVFYDRQLVDETFGTSHGTGQEAQGKKRGLTERAAAASEPEIAPKQRTDGNLVVLREIARVLRPGGGLLLEVPNKRALKAAVAEAPRRHLVGADYEIQEEYQWDEATSVLRNRTRFRMNGREEDGEYTLRLYDRPELKALAESAGLRVKRCFGDYEGGPFRPAQSDILLIHAVKPLRKRKN